MAHLMKFHLLQVIKVKFLINSAMTLTVLNLHQKTGPKIMHVLFIYICMAELWFRCFEYYHAYRSGNTSNECLCVGLEQNLWLT